MLAGAVIVGNVAGFTVIVLDTDVIVLPQASVADQVSVTAPPQGPGVAVKVDGLDVPVIRHAPAAPLVYVSVLAAGIAPQATVMFAGAVIVGNAAGFTVIVLDTDTNTLPHASVAVHVCVTGPPHPDGVAENVDALDVPLIRHGAVNPLV